MRFRMLIRLLGAAFIPGLIGAFGLFSAAFAAAADDTVMVGDGGGLGQILTDAKGMTLYTWDRDDPKSPTVAVNASATWPPLIVSGSPTGPAGLPGVLGAATKLDGTLQVTFNGWPLYYNINDKAPGQTVGDGVGGIWHAVPLSMDMMMAPASVAIATNPSLGSILTTPDGMTLYNLSADTAGKSTCIGGCTGPWPPLMSDGNAMAPDGLEGTLSAITREDATMQVAYNGMPLYTFVRDTAPGQTNGQGVTAFGGTWSVAMAAAPTATVAIGRQVRPGGTDRDALTDAAGMSLYYLSQDEGTGGSICYAANECTEYWPPMLLQGEPIAPSGLSGKLGALQRTDGTVQLTYNGRPLYYYVVDRKPGDFTGQGVVDTWGSWFATAVQ